jgi:predicted RNase H-like HicB family nuclease
MQITFKTFYEDGCWCACGIEADIFTHGRTIEELIKNIDEAVSLHFEDEINAGEQITVLSHITFRAGSVAEVSGC